MKHLLIAPLILTTSSSSFVLSQPIKIPVTPFDYKPHHVSSRIHRKCDRLKTDKAYWRCVNRFEQKITTSLDMDLNDLP